MSLDAIWSYPCFRRPLWAGSPGPWPGGFYKCSRKKLQPFWITVPVFHHPHSKTFSSHPEKHPVFQFAPLILWAPMERKLRHCVFLVKTGISNINIFHIKVKSSESDCLVPIWSIYNRSSYLSLGHSRENYVRMRSLLSMENGGKMSTFGKRFVTSMYDRQAWTYLGISTNSVGPSWHLSSR